MNNPPSSYGYTHNLHIVLSDSDGNLISNPRLMSEIYEGFANKHIKRNVLFLGKSIELSMYWCQCPVTYFDKNFIGDLFTTPIHSDAALYEITTNVLWEIQQTIKERHVALGGDEQDWKIMFHISKFLDPLPAAAHMRI
jgi:hypothetical protein